MERVRRELRDGWLDVRWTIYFLLLLLPGCVLATALAASIERTLTPSPALLLLFGVPGAVLALIGAGIWEGPRGRLGRNVWMGLVLFTGYLLVRQFVENRQVASPSEAPLERTIRMAGHKVQLLLTVNPDQKQKERRFGWRDLLLLHPQPLDEGMHQVLIGV
jgi:hypothetical protein